MVQTVRTITTAEAALRGVHVGTISAVHKSRDEAAAALGALREAWASAERLSGFAELTPVTALPLPDGWWEVHWDGCGVRGDALVPAPTGG